MDGSQIRKIGRESRQEVIKRLDGSLYLKTKQAPRDHVNDAVRTGIMGEGRTGPGASARCAIPFASMVTGGKGDSTSEREAERPSGRSAKTYRVQAHGALLLNLNSGRSFGCTRMGLQARSLLWT